MSVLQNIRDLASMRGISLAELERQTKLSSGSITKWDKSSPSADKLNKIADFFDVSVDYLLGRTELKKPIATDEDPVETMLKTVMSSDGKPLTENDRNILRGIIEAYLKNKE